MTALLALGSNGSGQLGILHDKDVDNPEQSVFLDLDHCSAVQQVAAGGNHTLVLWSDGRLYQTGANQDGRCFGQRLSLPPSLLFNQVKLTDELTDAKFSLCAATWEASFGVLQDGRLICSGTGNRGELGLGQSVSLAPSIQIMANFPPTGATIIDIAAGMNHVVALLSNGQVYGWGAGKKGQIGQPRVDSWTPRKISDVPFLAHRVVVGTNFTFIAGDPLQGDHLFIGLDKWSVASAMPTRLPPWKDIVASWGSIYVLLTSGQLLSWGRNDHCQLCPPDLPKIRAIAAGSEHVVCMTELGQVIAWGWGEHGNCGKGVSGPSFDCMGNVLPIPVAVNFVGAGCATSWLSVSRADLSEHFTTISESTEH